MQYVARDTTFKIPIMHPPHACNYPGEAANIDLIAAIFISTFQKVCPQLRAFDPITL
jgi:hypothetical protein